MGLDSSDKLTLFSLDERIELIAKLYKQTLKHCELRDEVFAQVSKQTRKNPDRYLSDNAEILQRANVLVAHFFFHTCFL